MLSKQYKEAVFYKEQYLHEDHIQYGYDLMYYFKNVNDRLDTNTLVLKWHNEGYVFYNVDENYTCWNIADLDDDDSDQDIEDIFDCYLWEFFADFDNAIISVMHDCPDEDFNFRPNFNNYSEMISFYEKMKKEGLVSNIEEFLTEQVCSDFKQDLESTLAAYNAGVPLEDILVDD